MEIYVHPCQKKNVGDEFNRWIWREIFGDALFEHSDDKLLVGIGTVLNDNLPSAGAVHILGSGVGYGEVSHVDRSHWHIHFLRGLLSADALGVDNKLVISDPGILINKLRPQQVRKTIPISFMPHLGIDSLRYRQFIEQVMGWHYISPSDEEERILSSIASSEKLITSAMHGAIIADAYRTPWFGVKTSPEILPFKWMDWFSSLQITHELTALPAYWGALNQSVKSRLVNIVKERELKRSLLKIHRKGEFILSNEMLLCRKQKDILNKLEEVKPLLQEVN